MDNLFKIENNEEFIQALEEVLNNLFELNKSAANEDIKNLLFQTSFQENEIEEVLTSRGYDVENIKYFISLLNVRKQELMSSALTCHNSLYGEVVTNFDWALKLSYGTNELCNLRYPLLQLYFNTYKNRESSQKAFDVTKDGLAKLISALESVDM